MIRAVKARRRSGAASGPPKQAHEPTVAVVTMARDEGPMLRLWADFYARAVGRENLFVFDDHTTDGSTDALGVTVHKLPELPGAGFFERARLRLVSGVAAGLLDIYDYTIFVDVDEFLIPDPAKFPDLKSFLARRPRRDIIAAMALNVLHDTRTEGDLDFSRPILEQRQLAKFLPLMCKPAIKRVPANRFGGSHGVDQPYVIDPGLFMLHLKFADRATLRRIADRRLATGRSPRSSWSQSGDQITAMLTEFVGGRDPDTVPIFRPRHVRLDRIVRETNKGYKSFGLSQLNAMAKRPLVRIPPRLRGSL